MLHACRIAVPPPQPLMIFDGDCGFCRRWIARWQQLTGDKVRYAPSQEVARLFPEINPEEFQRSVILVDVDGRVYSGSEAVFRSLAVSSKWAVLLRLYQNFPGFAALTEWSYRQVASHRQLASALTRWIVPDAPAEHGLVRSLFLRGVGLVYLVAFASLWAQISGLIGRNGIIPIASILESTGRRLSAWASFWQVPTLSWINPGDGFLHFQCAAGILLSLLLVLGVGSSPVLFFLWLFYLSLTAAGGAFMSFQWDILLLETGFLAVLFAPPWARLSAAQPPSRLVLWMIRWLLFRLMFQSGAVKLLSGDLAWSSLAALRFHYETQPLPTLLAWFAHQAPEWVHQSCVVAVFSLELVVPFFIFGPRRTRLAACWLLIGFQIAIALTGNYGFFNLLTIVLCLALFDDQALLRLSARIRLPRIFHDSMANPGSPQSTVYRPLAHWPLWLLAPACLALFLCSSAILLSMFRMPIPSPVRFLLQWQSPFRIVNSYGLFAVMTIRRAEIVLEASDDGEQWKPYPFQYKPGPINQPPRFAAPHQPRLDWQMWFAALSRYEDNPWFANLCFRLLQAQPEVLKLFDSPNTWSPKPPRFIRGMLYEYQFTDPITRRETGHWWRREQIGPYSPVLARRRLGPTRGWPEPVSIPFLIPFSTPRYIDSLRPEGENIRVSKS